ncbi:glutathione synthase/RimK-type ligase-like ATP-grasp enzyme [Actinoalloteichus hoggarensis]|uniref:Cycloserine biosynthesis protein DcsG n=1 Tax=Actinoalloteichus hoggarensis TaxID=1470176 RepID=A0A221W2J8_9PSEU|nr:hypothetical protein [Actinoalloteichus hoggarensis]ASO19996.1 Cycloserine biosynthesis protein DcsG [Actinoalloteichus hoggarensis]MBB5919294.1 glutathione synthase/RimK-type ligase-like ATP-grasp enzyme [Actinoalloteichus hoggarensis]
MTARPLVLLATCQELPGGYADDIELVAAFAEQGISASWAPWDDTDIDFAAADLVLLRSPWDYMRRLDEFLAWCDSLPRLANPASVVRWNTDKRYLVALAEAGVAVVPGSVVPPGERPAWPATEFVIKPTVGAGSVEVGRFTPDRRAEAAAHLAALHASGATALLQPYQASVDTEGETALVFFAGVFSHAFHKPAMLDGGPARARASLADAEVVRPARAGDAHRAVAESALGAAARLLRLRRQDLLYARVDLIADDTGSPLVLELELSEPLLGLRLTDASARRRLAAAVAARLRAG